MSKDFIARDYLSGDDRLFYGTLGCGPDAVLLHPTPVDHRFWMPVALRLKDRYRFTIPDLRGHGRSEAGQGPVTIERLAGDVERLLDVSGIERACFAGCSIGGYILYELWRRMPQRVRALAICCGKPQPDSAASRAKRQENIDKIRRQGTDELFDQMVASLVAPAFYEREPAKVAELRAAMNAVTPEAEIAVQQGLMSRPGSESTLKTISVPVLALAGEKDTFSTPDEMKIIPESLPDAEYHVLRGAGHFAPYEDPETVSGVLDRFFGRVCD